MSDIEGIKKRKVMSTDETESKDQVQSSDLQVGESSPPKNLSNQEEGAPLEPKQMDIDNCDFAAVSQLPNYVDLTMVVARIQNGSDVILVTAPKGWGKSTAISTLKRFYEIELKPNGEKITDVDILRNITVIKDTPNYKLFERTMLERVQFDIMNHLGKYPVIWMKFRGNVKNGQDALTNCRDAIHAAYQEHEYLKNSTALAPGSISRVKKWCSDEEYLKMNWNDVASSLKKLSQYLCKHWERKCVILIDDYDAITMSLLNENSTTSTELNLIQNHLVGMLSYALKGNEFLHKGFLTGLTHVFNLWSSVNNVDKRRFAGKYDITLYSIHEDVWDDKKNRCSYKKSRHISTW